MLQNPVTPEIGMEKPILSPISGKLWCGVDLHLMRAGDISSKFPSFFVYAFFLGSFGVFIAFCVD